MRVEDIANWHRSQAEALAKELRCLDPAWRAVSPNEFDRICEDLKQRSFFHHRAAAVLNSVA